MELYSYTAPCLFGLESVLNFEVKQIGGTEVQSENGRVNFKGDLSVLAKANLWLRTAERVNLVLATFKATTFTQLFDEVGKIPFERYIGKNDEFPVKGWSIDSQLENIPSCQSIIKKSVVERLKKFYKIETFPETGILYQIAFSIHKDEVTVMLDTTGVTLHKRGYRTQANIAPIRETLAAGIVDLARVRDNNQVYDPLCGSGTLVIEAAQRAMNIAPGLNRSFAAEEWAFMPAYIWEDERKAAKSAINPNVDFHGYGYDIDPHVVRYAQANAKRAGVADKTTFSCADVANFKPKAPAVILTNPPYGERIMEKEEAAELYRVMGKTMPKEKGVSYYIIASQDDFEESFGRKADRRRKLYNGMIPAQLYMYFR